MKVIFRLKSICRIMEVVPQQGLVNPFQDFTDLSLPYMSNCTTSVSAIELQLHWNKHWNYFHRLQISSYPWLGNVETEVKPLMIILSGLMVGAPMIIHQT